MEQVAESILVERGCLPTEAALVQDALRMANWIGQTVRYDVRVCTTDELDLVVGLGCKSVRAGPLDLDDAVQPKFFGGSWRKENQRAVQGNWAPASVVRMRGAEQHPDIGRRI